MYIINSNNRIIIISLILLLLLLIKDREWMGECRRNHWEKKVQRDWSKIISNNSRKEVDLVVEIRRRSKVMLRSRYKHLRDRISNLSNWWWWCCCSNNKIKLNLFQILTDKILLLRSIITLRTIIIIKKIVIPLLLLLAKILPKIILINLNNLKDKLEMILLWFNWILSSSLLLPLQRSY